MADLEKNRKEGVQGSTRISGNARGGVGDGQAGFYAAEPWHSYDYRYETVES